MSLEQTFYDLVVYSEVRDYARSEKEGKPVYTRKRTCLAEFVPYSDLEKYRQIIHRCGYSYSRIITERVDAGVLGNDAGRREVSLATA